MRQQISVYLDDANRHWLRNRSEDTGLGMSTLVNLFVAEKRKADPTYIGEVNRSLENALVADSEISNLVNQRLENARKQAEKLNQEYLENQS